MSAASGSGVPVLSKDQLEYIADQHTLSFSRFDGKEDPGFSAWKFAAYYLKKTVRFEWLSNDGCILGLSSFAKGTKIPVFLPDENGMDWLEIGPDGNAESDALQMPALRDRGGGFLHRAQREKPGRWL